MTANGGYDVRVYDTPADLVPTTDTSPVLDLSEGELGAASDTLGTGAEGDYRSGEATGAIEAEPGAEPQGIDGASAVELEGDAADIVSGEAVEPAATFSEEPGADAPT